MGVVIQPLNHCRVAADAKVGDRGRVSFLGHTVPPTAPYKTFNN